MIGSSRNSISWMKKSRSTFSQKEDGTLRYPKPFFRPCTLDSSTNAAAKQRPTFSDSAWRKKNRWDHAERHVKETDMVEILLTSCKGLMIYHDLSHLHGFRSMNGEWMIHVRI